MLDVKEGAVAGVASVALELPSFPAKASSATTSWAVVEASITKVLVMDY